MFLVSIFNSDWFMLIILLLDGNIFQINIESKVNIIPIMQEPMVEYNPPIDSNECQ